MQTRVTRPPQWGWWWDEEPPAPDDLDDAPLAPRRRFADGPRREPPEPRRPAPVALGGGPRRLRGADPPAETAWMAAAPCRGHYGLFVGTAGERPKARFEREAEALAICARCPHQGPCRDYARAHDELGVWGGETEEQRYRAGWLSSRVAAANIVRKVRAERRAEGRAAG